LAFVFAALLEPSFEPFAFGPMEFSRRLTVPCHGTGSMAPLVIQCCIRAEHGQRSPTLSSTALRFYVARTHPLRGERIRLLLLSQRGRTGDIDPATRSSWINRTVRLDFSPCVAQCRNCISGTPMLASFVSWPHRGRPFGMVPLEDI